MAAKSFSLFFAGILCIATLNLYCLDEQDIKGFDKGIFNYHFEKAGRETDPVSWMREARQGLELAIANWERLALEVYDDPEARMIAEKELVQWSEEELEKRYAQWLFKRFFGNSAGNMAKTLDIALDRANRLYVYHTGEDGNILYGETGDPLPVRPAEGRSVEEDLLSWNKFVSQAGEAELQNYQFNLASSLPELLAYIKEEDRSRFEILLGETAANAFLSRQAEFEALLAREERLFVARRTGDIWSLRKQSENESAAVISSHLIQDAEDLSTAGIAALEEQIEAARAGTGDLALAGTEWLDAFEEQFDRGLKAWAYAEERFMIRRMEWERDSGVYFLEGEEAWKTAFTELENQRLAWENKAHELFNAGEQLFINASEELQKSITEARTEFQKDAALRRASAAERASAWVDMYVTCGSVLAEARDSVSYWLSRFVSGAPANALENGSLGSWVQQVMAGMQLNAGQTTAGTELIRWSALYTQYRDKARESLEILEKEFGLALGMDAGTLNSVLGSESENFFLDEYQIELLRAKAIAAYWEQRLAIAEAVSFYARELSAGRLTEEESLLQWRDAKAQYDDALVSYETVQEELQNAGLDLASIQIKLQSAAETLMTAEQKLDDLNNRYAIQMAAYRVNSGDFILEELGSYYIALTDLSESRRQDEAYYAAYLQAELKYTEEYTLQSAWTLLKSIITNSGDEEIKRIQLALLSTPSAADWYFTVSGKEKTEESARALEEEGVFERLKREALEETAPGTAATFLSVYRELAPYAPGVQKEEAASIRRALGEIFAGFGIETNGEEFSSSAVTDGLLQYGVEHELSPGFVIASLFVKIDEVTELFPMMIESELTAWKEKLIVYMAGKVLYKNIAVPENTAEVLEKYEELITGILDQLESETGSESLIQEVSFYQYLIGFLMSYENASAEAAAGEENWRTSIGLINPADSSGSWVEGFLADAFESAEEERRKLTEAFSLFLGTEMSGRQRQFTSSAEFFLSNPDTSWEDPPADYELAIRQEILMEESEKLQNKTIQEESFRQQIARLGQEYNKLLPSGQAALDEINNISAEMETTRIQHQQALGHYKQMAAEYSTAGEHYEMLYSETKKIFANLDAMRIEYEKQDAVRRWASTSYLSQSSVLPDGIQYYKEPAEELLYVRERYDRAHIALTALQDLYNNGEAGRPYADEEYTRLYQEYQESFSRMFLTLKTKTEFAAALEAEKIRNRELYLSFASMASSFLNPLMFDYYGDYSPPELTESTWMDFVHVTESGNLGISFDNSSFVLTQTTPDEAAVLSEYFKNKSYTGDGQSQMSAFESAVARWSARLAAYNLGNYQTLGLAFDFITRELTENNPTISSIQGAYTLTDMGSDGNIKLDGDRLDKLLDKYRNGGLPGIQQNAWNSLDAQQKEDLEFLAILFLTGGGGEGASGLTRVSEAKEMDWLYRKAAYYKTSIKFLFFKMTVYRWPYTFDHSELDQVFSAVGNRGQAFYRFINSNGGLFLSETSKTASEGINYQESCHRLTVFTKKNDEGINWNDIESALELIGNIEKPEIKTAESYWNDMVEYYHSLGNHPVYVDISSALDALYAWGKGIRDTLEIQFENAYLADAESGKINQDEYRKIQDAYINGKSSLEELNEAAQKAYGSDAPALKNHLDNLGTTLISDLKNINAERAVYTKQYRDLAAKYTTLIERAYAARFDAELAVREIEWQEQQKDLYNKLETWHEAAGLILERGRQDWKKGFESMQAACIQWEENFAAQYTLVDDAWNAAYLESLNNKESWINQALIAANEALDNTLLMLIGTDAESYSRRLDTFMPSSIPGFGETGKAAAALRSVLDAAGIKGLYGAFTSMAGTADTVLTRVRNGSSGLGVWNSGQVQAAAKDLAWKSTSELAAGKMVMLAFQAREAIDAAKMALEENVVQSNDDFDGSMDELYTMEGGWKRSGNNYIKDIIVHSTVFRNAITDTVIVDSYQWFVLDYWEITTDLSDANLEGLDYLGIQALVALAQSEVEKKSLTVFGDDSFTGAFTLWVGEDQKSGELGRLMSEYYEWSAKQAQGIAAMNAPLWDKPLWDSRESWFSAPNMRTVSDIAMSVVSAVMVAASPFTAGATLLLAVGVNLIDDVVFNTLDAAYGYKSWGDAGFAFGKKALITTATTVAGAAFNGAGNAVGLTAKAAQSASTQMGSVIAKTAVSSVQAITTSTVTSALSAVSYQDGKFGWSKDTFKSGMQSGLIGMAVAGAGTFTSSSLNLGIEGFYGSYYDNGSKLSSLIGGLAGQGVNYAFGGDFTLNAFNLGFMNKNAANTGLLELHFGRDGFSSEIGSGGVDVSVGTIAGAARGLEAWKVNFDIWNSGSGDAREYISQLRTLYSGNETTKEEYEAILAGTTRIFENSGADFTQSVYDPVTGIKNIFLGKDALDDGSRFGLNVVFGHEAYRNGEDDGAGGQQMETDRAVFGHISTALGLMQTYGLNILGPEMQERALDFAGSFYTYMSESSSAGDRENALENLMGIFSQFDSDKDYWRLVKKTDNSYGVRNDGNHSLLDENGRVIVRSILDIFDNRGNIIGHHYNDSDSYARSLGMLLGLYPDFNQGSSLKDYRLFASYDSVHLGVSKDAMNGQSVINVNPYLMTYKEIVNGRGYTISGGGVNKRVVLSIMDEYNKVKGHISFKNKTGERDYVMIENMIPEGKRMKAGTISVEINGFYPNVKMFGLGTTLPDPGKMSSQHPALLDGNYRYAWSIHAVASAAPYRAFRLFNRQPDSWESVTGPRPKSDSGIGVVPDFAYNPKGTSNNWGGTIRDFKGYYYDSQGNNMVTGTNQINGHKSYSNPFVTKPENGYTAGSLGCMVWVPTTFYQLSSGLRTTEDHKDWGNFIISRSLFGDGTNKNNNWSW
jgi:hypothetical protein